MYRAMDDVPHKYRHLLRTEHIHQRGMIVRIVWFNCKEEHIRRQLCAICSTSLDLLGDEFLRNSSKPLCHLDR